jgi:lactate permease
MQFLCSNFISYPLTDVLSSITSIGMTLLLLRWWQPAPDARFAFPDRDSSKRRSPSSSLWRACLPWTVVSLTVTTWTTMRVFTFGEAQIQWPGLHDAVSITL